MKPDITIIVPVYNVEKYISKCLDSILNQTYKNFEVWVVDDGSPDNSERIINEYVKNDSRVKLIVKENGGYGSVLNYCIKRIKTKYFLICDPDDWLKNTALSKLHLFAEANDLDIVVADKYNVYVNGSPTQYSGVNVSNVNITPKIVYSNPIQIQLFSFLLVSPHAKLYKTYVAKKIKFPKKVSYSDFLLYIVSLCYAKRISYYNSALAYYLIDRPGNTTTGNDLEVIKNYLVVWKTTLSQILSSKKSTGVLLSRMYAQIELILFEYARVSKCPFHDGYEREIYNLIKELQKFKKSFQPSNKNLLSRFFFVGLMNRYVYKMFARLYVRIRSGK